MPPPREHFASGRMYFSCEGGEPSMRNLVERIGFRTLLFASDFPHESNMDRAMREIVFAAKTDLAATLVRKGEFTQPAPKLTVYGQDVDADGLAVARQIRSMSSSTKSRSLLRMPSSGFSRLEFAKVAKPCTIAHARMTSAGSGSDLPDAKPCSCPTSSSNCR